MNARTIINHWEWIIASAGIAVVLNLVLMIFMPFEFRAATQLMVIQKNVPNYDAYTAIKSAERVGMNLSYIVYTSSFFDAVIAKQPVIAGLFPSDDIKRRKAWERAVEVTVLPETGILVINAYHTDVTQARLLAQTVAEVMAEAGPRYHGESSVLEISIIDAVVASTYPVRPNVVMQVLVACLFGSGIGIMFALFKEARVRDAAVSSSQKTSPKPIEIEDEGVHIPVSMPVFEPVPVSYIDESGVVASADLPAPRIITMHDHLG